MLESTVWGKFYVAWPWHCERHEPGAGDVDSGFPDVLVLDRNGKPGLLELKRPDRVELNNNQWAWHERYHDRGGRSCIVTCLNRKGRIGWYVLLPDFKARELLLARDQLLSGAQMVRSVATRLKLEL